MPQSANNSNRLAGVTLEEEPGVSFEENRLVGVSVDVPSFSIPKNTSIDMNEVIKKSGNVGSIVLETGLPRSAIDRWYHFLDKPLPVRLPIEDTTATTPVPQPEGKSTLSGQIIGGTIETAAWLADFPRTALMAIGQLPYTGGIGMPPAEGFERATPEQIRADPVYRAAAMVSERSATGRDFLLSQHPEWQQDPPKSLMDALKHPSKLAKGIARAIPLLAGAGFSIASGHAGAGMLLMFTSEKGAAKANFKSKGATEDKAERGSNIYGVIATCFEYLQVQRGLKLLGSARDIILHRAAQKAAATGAKSLSKEVGITVVLESLEEMGQGTSEDVIGLLMLSQPIEGGVKGFVDRRAQEALFATALSLLTMGAGVTAGIAAKKPTKAQVTRFREGFEAKRGEIEKARQEGRIKDEQELIEQIVAEAIAEPTTPAEGKTPEIEAEAAPTKPTEKQPKHNRFANATTSEKDGLLKSFYQERPNWLDKPEMAERYKEFKESLTPEEQKDFAPVLGIIDKQLAKLQPPAPAKPVGEKVVRYTVGETGLLNNAVLDRMKLTDDEEAELIELMDFGLQQPIEVPTNATFAFTKEGEKKHARLLELLKKAARGKVIRTEIDVSDDAIVWKTNDGQVAFTPAKPVGGKEAAARDILGGVDPIQEITKALKEAVAVRPKTEAEIHEGRKRQVAKAASIKEQRIAKGGSIEEALLSAAGLRNGPLANYNNLWEPIRDRINESNPAAIESAFALIENNENLQFFQKRDTADAFRKLIDGQSITMREVDLIKTQFGIELGKVAESHSKKNSLAEKAVALWRAGLLTGIKTSGLNTLSNLGHGLTETAVDVPAAGFDRVASLFTGERTLVFTTKGTLKGAKEGFQKGVDYMKTGIDERHLAEKYEFQRINFGDSKFAKGLQAYEETIFHLMGAEDQPFYYGAKARSLFSQAYAQGKNKGLKGKELQSYVDETVQKPSDEMLAMAAHDAQVAVFQNRTAIGDIFSAIHKSSITGKVLVPFSRTPSAVAMQIVNYSPAGAVLELSKQIQKGEFNQRNFSRAMGRTTIGTGALYLGTQLFAAGMINLGYPDNEKERELWKVEGRKPHSVKVDGKWRSVEVLGPVGSVLIVGGYFQKAMDETGSPSKAIVTAMAGAGKTFSEQTAIRGLSQAAKAISEPERSFEAYFSGLAGSVVPTIVADVARATDYTERRTSGPFQKIIGRIPYARKTLPPQVDVYGQDMPRYGGNLLEVMIDPSRPVKIRQDIVTDEIRRLWDEGIRVAPTKLGDRQGYDILTSEENTVMWRRAGDLVYRAMFDIVTGQQDTQNVKYANLTDEEKGKVIDNIVKANKDVARAEAAMHKMSTGTTLEELEEDGLVTEDVKKVMYNLGVR